MFGALKRQTPRQCMAVYRGHFHVSSAVQKGKDSLMDKDAINTESREYSKSGGDGAAAHTDDAFSTDKTRPEEQGDSEGSLNVSPANTDSSQARGAQEGGAQGSEAETGTGTSSRSETSGKGSPPKAGRGQ